MASASAPTSSITRSATLSGATDAMSKVGRKISNLASPLLGVITRYASTLVMSMLKALQTVTYLLIGLQPGAWCGRMYGGHVLVASDFSRAIALANRHRGRFRCRYDRSTMQRCIGHKNSDRTLRSGALVISAGPVSSARISFEISHR